MFRIPNARAVFQGHLGNNLRTKGTTLSMSMGIRCSPYGQLAILGRNIRTMRPDKDETMMEEYLTIAEGAKRLGTSTKEANFRGANGGSQIRRRIAPLANR